MSLRQKVRSAYVFWTSDPRMDTGQKPYLAAFVILFSGLAVISAAEGEWGAAAATLGVAALAAFFLIRRFRATRARRTDVT